MHPGGSASGGGGLASRGRGVCIQGEGSASRLGSLHPGGLHPGGLESASRGGSALGWVGGNGQTPELEKRAIHILLECFLDTLIFFI